MVGDVDQLPSVGAGNVFSELIKSEIIPTTVLDKPFRQAEGDLIYINASKINQGKCDLEYGMDFEFIPAHGEKEISDICCKKYSEIVEKNAGNLDSVALLTPFRKKTKIGANEINLTIRDKVNLNSNKTIVNAGSISYMLGDKVMQLKNITEDGISLSNGDIGYVKALATGTENDAYVVVEYSEIGEKTYKTHDDFEMLDLAYASTVHKAQGSEVDYVIMPVSKIFKVLLKRNIIYTGISRAKKGVILVGDKVSLEAAIKDNTYANRNTILGVRIRQEVNKKEGQMAFDFDSI
jgi:exodeoxyribonuclease V alpha subunit